MFREVRYFTPEGLVKYIAQVVEALQPQSPNERLRLILLFSDLADSYATKGYAHDGGSIVHDSASSVGQQAQGMQSTARSDVPGLEKFVDNALRDAGRD